MSAHMQPPIDIAELLRYVTGEGSVDDVVRVERWLCANDTNTAFLRALCRGRDGGGVQVAVDVHQGMALLRQRIDDAASCPKATGWRAPLPHQRLAPASVTRLAWYTAAGVISVIFGAVAVFHGRGGPVSGRVASAAATMYVTAAGQQANVSLPDGSTVLLNVASRLGVPSDFAAGNRMLTLDGEALFHVAHRSGTPFMITAGPAVTRVLGTTFVVRHYTGDTATLVAVRDGKVAVQSVVLSAGQQAMAGGHDIIRVLRADPARFTFASGVLTLGLVPLKDAVQELNQWYDADIRVADPVLAERRLQGSFASGSLSDLASVLEFTLDARVVRNGRVLILYPR